MSRARKEQRDAGNGTRFVRRIILTITNNSDETCRFDIDPGGLRPENVIKILRDAALALENKLAEKAASAERMLDADRNQSQSI